MEVLVESAIRATLLAVAAFAVLWIMRVRTAAGRHAVWTLVLAGMVVLPMWTMWGPKALIPINARPRVHAVSRPTPGPPMLVTGATVGSEIPGEFPAAGPEIGTSTVVPVTRSIPWRIIVLAVYAVGVFLLLGRLTVGTLHARRLIRQGVQRGEFLTSNACSAPVTVGWIRPVVILPEIWESWSDAQLQAVMLHEQEHARRRDPLIQWVALANRAVFWFHPLAWWLERHLAELAENACDTAVLSKGHQPAAYCEYLLSMARAVTRAGARLHVVGAAMPGAFLSQRIRRILGGAPESRLAASRLALTLVVCAAASVALIAGTPVPNVQPQPGSRQSGTNQPLPEDWFADDEWHLETAPLMSERDMERYPRLRTVAERDTFISDFWNRLDPTPDTPANEFRQEFEGRVRYAKEHYVDPDSGVTFGYQTDRGRWHVISGPPDAVRVVGSRVDVNGRNRPIEEWNYQWLNDFGSNVSIRFDPASMFGCTYRGGKYRIVSPPPVKRFEGVTSAGSGRRPYAQTYPGHFVYVSFPIDEQAVAIRWGMRTGSDGQLILDEDTAPIDYVQGEIGSVADDPTRPMPRGSRPPQPLLEHLRELQFFESNGIACTEQLPPATYTLKIESRLTNGAVRRDSVTFIVE